MKTATSSAILRDDAVQFLIGQNSQLFDALEGREAELSVVEEDLSTAREMIRSLRERVNEIESKSDSRASRLSQLNSSLGYVRVCE